MAINLQYPPPQWTQEQTRAFNVLMNAVELYELYAAAITRLGTNNATLLQRRNELRDHILNTLGPAFINA